MKKLGIIFLILLAAASIRAQVDAGRWQKPYEFGYYNVMVGREWSDAISTRDGSSFAMWGQARMSFVDMIKGEAPHRVFQVRDIADVQFGVGAGKEFYLNFGLAYGLKFKFDISKHVDFGFNFSGRMAIDRISYFAFMPQAFMRVRNVYLEAGAGGNGYDEENPSDKDRRLYNLSLKYYLKTDKTTPWSINLSYWQIQGMYLNMTQIWENERQVMIGVGRNLSNY